MRLLPLTVLILVSNATANNRSPIPGNSFQYYEIVNGSYLIRHCRYSEGRQTRFNAESGECEVSKRHKRQVMVGYYCFENTDCTSAGMYCDSTKRCSCLSTFVQISGTCWQKVDPDDTGCVTNRQCDSVWPGSYCSSGTCKCANGQPSFATRDGRVCLNWGGCPINGEYAKYMQPSNAPTECSSDSMCPNGYECVFSSPYGTNRDDTFSFCCPSRGMACVQGLDEGDIPYNGGGGFTRWWYNPMTGSCEQFNYRGQGGNANNFESKDHCESYCKLRCDRGEPARDDRDLLQNTYPGPPKQTFMYCGGSVTCSTDYSCTAVGTRSICCPTASFICSKKGGISTVVPYRVSIYDAGALSPRTSKTYNRFYYDPDTQRCNTFVYNGQAGNFNNFLTKGHCETFCATVVCPAGEPIKDISGIDNVECSSGSLCPATHECSAVSTKSVCCPKKQFVCSLPKSVGTCGQYVERWWFNAATRNCEIFTYSGCQSNANNFGTYIACQTFCKDATAEPKCVQGKAAKDSSGVFIVCGGSQTTSSCPANYECFFDGSSYGCCPTQAYTCTVTYDIGTSCGPTVSRWYYSPATRTCQNFAYLGCDGGPNNFATQQDCQDFCGAGGCPEGGEPLKELSGSYRLCSGSQLCPDSHYCTQVSFGTTNLYNYCCPTRAYICSLPQEPGQRCLLTTMERYFFNAASRNCEVYSYNGCGGNRNNFPSTTQCLNYCNSAGCPSGTIVLKDSANAVKTCTPGSATSCYDSGSYGLCVYSKLLQQNVCCGAPGSIDKCPTGQSTYIDALTLKPSQCTPNVAGNCPSGYFCWFSSANNGYFCCGSASTQCTQGGSPYVNPQTNVAQQCTPGLTGNCPDKFSCQATSLTIAGVQSATGYCCSTSIQCIPIGVQYHDVCPNNGVVQIVNGSPVLCNPAQPTCQTPYTCQFSSAQNQNYCCTESSIVTPTVPPVCGALMTPYMLNSLPVACSPGSSTTNCPDPYKCQYYTATNSYFCCTSGTVSPGTPTNSAGCPPNMSPLLIGGLAGQAQLCTPGTATSCPTGYYCLYDSVGFRYLCCGSSSTPVTTTAVCPNGQQATMSCANSICNSGQECLTLSGGRFCCPITAKCTNGQTATQTCTQGSSVGCLANNNCVVTSGNYYCCPMTPTTSVLCPDGTSPYLNSFLNTPQTCVPNIVACPSEYTCSLTQGAYYCCKGSVATSKCSNGATPYIPFGTTIPYACNSQLGISACPPNYSCQTAIPTPICCPTTSSATSDTNGCPTGMAYLYGGTNIPMTCSPSPDYCPIGHKCTYSLRNGAFQCCTTATSQTNTATKPGDTGCTTDQQCKSTGETYAQCINGKCLCSFGLVAYSGRCISSCPWPYTNSNGICMSGENFQKWRDAEANSTVG